MGDLAVQDGAEYVEGWVDGWAAGAVRGWAWYPNQPDQRVVLELRAGDAVVGQAVASLYRGDLVGVGKARGLCGFAIRPDLAAGAAEAAGGRLTLRVRVAGGADLPGNAVALDEAAIAAAALQAASPSSLPVALDDGNGLSGFIEEFGPDRIAGWAFRAADPSPHVAFEIVEGGAVVGGFTADYWRWDIAETRQGDGRWAFAAAFPPALRSGAPRQVEIRLAGTAVCATAEPIRVNFPDHPRPPVPLRAPDEDSRRSTKLRPERDDAPDDVFLSVVVVFYNMRREAARTLTSLQRSYQVGIGALRYEVLCVDNGSAEPLDAAWVAGFGPEFRLVTPSTLLPSPCLAINEAAAAAAGRFIAVMIDGAHVLTPGVLRETWDALTEAPDAVLGLRQYFVGGDQRFLSCVGYQPAQEDILFDRIGWPRDGYGLFSIGGPVYENGNGWLGSMSESNFLVVPRRVWTAIGGMDERFSEPGAGFANLDLFCRAAAASAEPVIALVGEASFHQYHGGTTTNVDDDEKDRRVRGYEQAYAAHTGALLSGVPNTDIRLRGQVHTDLASRNRQRPSSPARLGITDRVRQAVLPIHYDEQAVSYLTAVYAESGLAESATWRGESLGVAPGDMLAIQEILHRQRVDCVLAVNASAGLLGFIADVQRLEGLGGRIVSVGGAARPGVAVLPASADDGAIAHAIAAAERVMVLYGARDERPVAELRRFAGFVTLRGYLVFLGTAMGQPWLGYSRNRYHNAVDLLLDEGTFAIDEGCTRHLVSLCPFGFLQRIGPVISLSERII